MSSVVAQVAVSAATFHIDKPYDYLVPPELVNKALSGVRVLVPFGRGNKMSEGVILTLKIADDVTKLKTVDSLIDEKPILSAENLKLALWMSDRFFCTVYDALRSMMPAKVSSKRKKKEKEHKAANADDIRLSKEQQVVYDELLPLLDSNTPEAALLYGVTGSGKTLVYIKLIKAALSSDKTAIVLVPEIALTPQTVSIFSSHFGDAVAVLHSALANGQRYDEWKRIHDADVRVVVGTRSAVFAPLTNIGLIVIDEEQEYTYKSGNPPRYHAREIAKYRITHSSGLLLMASATPSVDSMYAAKTGKYSLLNLKNRFNERELPPVLVVDMKKELATGNDSSISSVLRDELEKNINAGEQSILFINRRGANPVVACGECGFTYKCLHCSVSMTYHISNKRLLCHYCGYSIPTPESCPECSGKLKYIGTGTQKVEVELNELFPDVKIIRMEADTTSRVNSHKKLLSDFRKQKAQILLGTQMVTKGLDFENVTLVGVISADLSLYMSDYRSNEKTFSLITQVVGRSGRGEKPGRAIIQTFTPEHKVISLASNQDYDGFYESEISIRQLLGSPPVRDLIALTTIGSNESKVAASCSRLKASLQGYFRGDSSIKLLGPAPTAVSKVNNQYRYRLLVNCVNNKRVREVIAHVIKQFARDNLNRGVTVIADADVYD
ncbi:MAG: primosomal protein N' [Oscillospiraceae bacterium]|nr:primosomal protein N' [Oscillospiraceae bacterium]